MGSKKFLEALNFVPKENAAGIFVKRYPQAQGYAIEVNFDKELINYGDRIKADNKTTQNFSQSENFVVLECVNRLLEKGYKPENIVLEKTYPSGHGTSGRLDICVTHDDGSEYLLVECKTYGKEFDKAFTRMKKDGGQLFTYFKFSNKPDVIMLYASELRGDKIIYRNEIVKIEEYYRTGDVKDFYEKWNKLTKDNGVFEDWVKPYNFESKALTPRQLIPIKQEDSSLIFNQFLEILRHNVVSDKPNAFNKIFTLFLCKVYDEKTTKTDKELKFQWLDGVDKATGDNAYVDFLVRLSDLYKNGMLEFLEKEVTDFSEEAFKTKYGTLDDSIKKDLVREFQKIRLEKNNEFAIKEVFDNQSFLENSKIVKEVVELLQGYRIRYNKRQQYLSDFFEMLLTTGLKQESGQFFTPVPIAQFIIKSLPINIMVDEKLEKGEKNNLLPYVIDYAAGSGHFVTECMHEIQTLIDSKNPESYISDTTKKIKGWHTDHFDWATQYVYGVEKDYRLVKVGKVGCYLHGDGLANVILSDGLASFNHAEYKGKLQHTDGDFPKENKQFDILLSNPPYSVSSFKNTSTDYYTAKDFDLYNQLTANSSEIECLFVERTKQLLKDGGVAGVILPRTILSNIGTYSKVREILLRYFEIIAIAELGSNTFMATTTKTVALFLRRRNNYISINIKKYIDDIFINMQDVTVNGVEKPISKYINHVWENISFEDYKTLLMLTPNETLLKHSNFKDYSQKFKPKLLLQKILDMEKEKLLYFVLTYSQKTVWIKTGDTKDAEKRFLGYEFSDRRGYEGIHPIQRSKAIAECTKLFDEESFDNPEKASTYIYKAFIGDYDSPIHESLKDNIAIYETFKLLDFKKADFEYIVGIPKSDNIPDMITKWQLKNLSPDTVDIIRGVTYSKEEQVAKSNTIVLTADNITLDGKLKISKEVFLNDGLNINKNKKLNKDDIFMCFSSGSKNHLGKVALIETDLQYYAGGFMAILRVKEGIKAKYLYYLLNVLLRQIIIQKGTGSNINNLSSVINDIIIPHPPTDIQQKIVTEVETLEEKAKTIVIPDFDGEIEKILKKYL